MYSSSHNLPRRSLFSKSRTALWHTPNCNFICTPYKMRRLPYEDFHETRKCSKVWNVNLVYLILSKSVNESIKKRDINSLTLRSKFYLSVGRFHETYNHYVRSVDVSFTECYPTRTRSVKNVHQIHLPPVSRVSFSPYKFLPNSD